MNEKFTASTLKNPLFPDQVVLGEKGVTFIIRKALSKTENFVFYNDIAGVEVDSGVIWASIRVKARAREHEIVINNFAKRDASRIKELILERAHNQ